MGLLGAASDKQQYELTPVGEYVFTLWDLTLETGQWGDQIKWIWLISPVNDPDTYICRGEGAFEKERELWQFTKIGLPKGSRAREWAEALMGRELRLGEEPDDTDLMRHRMIAYLVHKPKKSDPAVKQESISEGSARPFTVAQPKRSAGAGSVSANASSEEIDAELAKSDALRKRVKKLMVNASLSEVEGRWSNLEPHEFAAMSDSDVDALGVEIEKALRQAVAA